MRSRLLVLFSFIFFAFCCVIDLILVTIDGDHSLPIQLEINGNAESINAIDGFRVSPSNKLTLLTQKFTDKANRFIIRAEQNNLYYIGIGLSISDTLDVKGINKVNVRVGNNSFTYNGIDISRKWELIEKKNGYKKYLFPNKLDKSYSVIGPFKKVVNWAGDKDLVLTIITDNLPLLFLLLFFLFSYSKAGNKILKICIQLISSRSSGVFFISIVIIAYRIPYVLQPIGAGVDMSWIIGLNWARNRDLAWGADIVFTYGPYYWLLVPSLILKHNWLLLSFVSTLSIFGVSVIVIVRRIFAAVNANKLPVQIALLFIMLVLIINYGFMDLILVSVLLLLCTDNTKSYTKHIILAVFLLSIMSLTKFSYFAVAIAILGIYTAYGLIHKRVWIVLSTWVTFIVAVTVLWIIADQDITNLPNYLTHSLEIGSGYSEAMATPFWKSTGSSAAELVNLLFLGLALLIFINISVLIVQLFIQKNRYIYATLLVLPVILLAFKEGYVRFDKGHFTQFFEQALLIVIFLVVVLYGKITKKNADFIFVFVGLICLCIVEFAVPHYYPNLLGVFSEHKQTELLIAAKSRLKKDYPLNDILLKKLEKTAEVDVLPWDISMLYAYDLNWQPRPIIQSYSVYTSKLDIINARHLQSSQAPDLLLYTFKTIDNRNPIFDEPLLLPELINRYIIEDQPDKTYVLLKKRVVPERIINQNYQQQKPIKLGQAIEIPCADSTLVFAKIDIKLTFLGELMNLLFKVPSLMVDFKNEEGVVGTSTRLIRKTAIDGLLVSIYVTNIDIAKQVLTGVAKPNVTSLTITGNKWIYKDLGTIAFTGNK